LKYSKDSVKTVLTYLCSNRLIVTIFPNQPELLFVQEVFHGNLQSLDYDLVDMYKLTLKIQEVIKFQR
jgi:hypothetical protein